MKYQLRDVQKDCAYWLREGETQIGRGVREGIGIGPITETQPDSRIYCAEIIPRISKLHVLIHLGIDGVTLTDKSRNGTSIGSTNLEPHKPTIILPGEDIYLVRNHQCNDGKTRSYVLRLEHIADTHLPE
jgi:hypothetical protein